MLTQGAPSDPARRGCQLSLRIKTTDGRGLYERITAAGITCDWREPDVMRVAPVPLYNRFEDAHRFVETLKASAHGFVEALKAGL
jgi:kynureninase